MVILIVFFLILSVRTRLPVFRPIDWSARERDSGRGQINDVSVCAKFLEGSSILGGSSHKFLRSFSLSLSLFLFNLYLPSGSRFIDIKF